MNWLGSAEVVIGIAALVLGLFLIRVFRYVPQPGMPPEAASATRLSIVPVMILLILVLGIVLTLTGFGLI